MKYELVEMFRDLASCYTYLGDPWRSKAYEKVAMILEGLPRDITNVNDVNGIAGIGASSLSKISEFINTGKCRDLIDVRKKCPPKSVDDFTKIPGVGPKTAVKLWKTHNVTTLAELKAKVDSGEIKDSKLKEGIEFVLSHSGRTPIGVILPVVLPILEKIRNVPGVLRAEFAGSLRRRKETIGDVDFLVSVEEITTTIHNAVKAVFGVAATVDAEGDKKIRARVAGIQMDVLFVPKNEYGAALQYFTGSKEHNVELRKMAKARGWLLNEKGLFDEDGKVLAQENEEDIYSVLGVPFLPPELREEGNDVGRTAPQLIEVGDVKGLLHNHTKWSDGTDSIEQLIQAAIRKGYKYIGITDHTESLIIAKGMLPTQWEEQLVAVTELAVKYKDKIQVLISAEMDVLGEGECDYSDELIRQMDYVTLALHRQPTVDVATRFITAIEHIRSIGYTKPIILAHPSGRQFGKTDCAKTDWNALFDVCMKHDVTLEINSLPERLDLEFGLCKQAKAKGLKFSISTDSHHHSHFDYVELGVDVARKAWMTKEDVINTVEAI